MTTQQPTALRLAEHLEKFRSFPDDQAAAAELRRLHEVEQAYNTLLAKTYADNTQQRLAELDALNQDLLEALKEISEASPKADHKKLARAAIAKAGETK